LSFYQKKNLLSIKEERGKINILDNGS